MGVGKLGGGFFWVEDAWDAEGETEMVGWGWEEGFGVGCSVGDCAFVCCMP